MRVNRRVRIASRCFSTRFATVVVCRSLMTLPGLSFSGCDRNFAQQVFCSLQESTAGKLAGYIVILMGTLVSFSWMISFLWMISPGFAPLGTGEEGNVLGHPDPEDFHRRLQIALIEVEKQKARHQRHPGLTTRECRRRCHVYYMNMCMYWVIFGISFVCTRDRQGE